MAAAVALTFLVAVAGAQERLTFVGVALDEESRRADRELQDELERRTGVGLTPEELEYAQVIQRLAGWRVEDGAFVARVTPYVYVVAEMLGADLDVLATYLSAATGRTTYRSYFVVRRSDFEVAPDVADLIRWIRRGERRRFVYHSEFSTSSFFLPSLLLRAEKIFNMDESTGSLTAIDSQRIARNSSSELVRMVAAGEADLAAVWDGTMSRFADTEVGEGVHFVPLPTAIPNDLLVCSGHLESAVEERLRVALAEMGPEAIAVGDFTTWVPIAEASEARRALADLRWLARERVVPVTVDMVVADGAEIGGVAEAIRQAIRLSASELVLYDLDFHEHVDYRWTVERLHDGAVLLRSSLPGTTVRDQEFRLSFHRPDDLTRRVVALIQNRLHRIRYLWPLGGDRSIVIRDLADVPPPGSLVKIQRIQWLDPERNAFRAGPVTETAVEAVGYHTVELAGPPLSGGAGVDALSPTAQRVYLLREQRQPVLYRVLTAALLLLLVVAAGALVADAARRRRGEGSRAVTALK